MEAAALWILIAVSTGYNNGGTVTVIARFSDKPACEAMAAQMPTGTLKSFCVLAKGAL